MPKTALRKEKWTLSFDPHLKSILIKESRKRRVYPVSLLEQIVRERFNPYGYKDIEDSVAYVQEIRKGSRSQSDQAFLKGPPLSVIIKKKTRDTVILPKKEYEVLKKAAEELDTLKAILIFEEERRGGKLKSFKNARNLIRDLDH